MEPIRWHCAGSLDSSPTLSGRGVYLFIYRGTPKRIIYVGTATERDFTDRWNEHLSNMKKGAFHLWRITPLEDVYALASYHSSLEEMQSYYKDLARQLRLWVPDSYPVNYLNPEDHFDTNWKDYVIRHYLPNIDVWACPVTSGIEVLETQIQRAIGCHFRLGFWQKASQNWLGKQQARGQEFTQQFVFDALPDVDLVSQQILSDLHGALNNVKDCL